MYGCKTKAIIYHKVIRTSRISPSPARLSGIHNYWDTGGQDGSEWTTCQKHPVHRLSAPGLQKTGWTTWTPIFGDDHKKKISISKKMSMAMNAPKKTDTLHSAS